MTAPCSARALANDRRGGVAIIAAASGALLCGLAAIVVDIGSVALEARRLQGAADLAALAAASDLARADAAGRATALANVQADDVQVVVGRYTAAPGLAPADRFVGGATGANAARVTLRSRAPLYFARLLTGRDAAPVARSATAARKAEPLAAFSIGSRLARLDGGVANAVLSALAGSNVSLTVMDYRALAGADVELLDWMEALRTDLDLEAGGFDRVLAAEADTGRALAVLGGLVDDPVAKSALDSLSRASAGRRAPLSALIDGDLIEAKGLRASLSALDLASGLLEVSNGSRQVDLDLGARAGLAAVDVRLAIGERPNRSPWLAVTGADQPVVRTAQARLKIRARTSGSLAALGRLDVPVIVELAPSEAWLDALECDPRTVRLQARPGVARAWIGEVSDAALADFRTPLAPTKATLVSVAGLVRVKARADAEVADLTPHTVAFSEADIAGETVKSVSTRQAAGSLLATLFGRAHVEVDALGLGLNLGLLKTQTQTLLAPLGATLDAAVAPLLDALGLKIGEADLIVHGLQCPARGRIAAELVS